MSTSASQKILCVLYDDPKEYPPKYSRDTIPVLTQYPDGQSLPTPQAIDFIPGELLGSVSGELGLLNEFSVTLSIEERIVISLW